MLKNIVIVSDYSEINSVSGGAANVAINTASMLSQKVYNAYGIPVIASDCSAASDNASFVYHSQKELEDFIIQVNTQDIKQLSIDTFNNFDESSTINYADNLLKVYNTPLMTN